MARKATTRQRLDALASELEPALARAFREAVETIVSQVELRRLVEALDLGDVEAAIRVLRIDQVAYRPLQEALRQAFIGGGAAVTGGMPALREPDGGGRLVIRFDVRNPRAEAWLQRESSQLVTRIVEDQRQAIRQAVTAGMEAGTNPRTTALSIVGRVNPATGQRVGGIVGLTAQQEAFVRNARAELLSGDPAQMRAYLERTRRDARFDAAVRRAITEGRALTAAEADRLTARYADRLLALRGEVIARTETLAALNTAQREAFEQAIDSGGVARQDVRRVWRTAADERVRSSHQRLNGESVGMDEQFSNGLLYPGEPGGAPEEVINCRCWADMRIDFLSNIR